ncbi:MAG: aspartate/glutamate racemase family protein [Pseudomonadota bacterium]
MIGILMLDTVFPRVKGDIGNPESFGFPVRYAVVPGATPQAIVCEDLRPWVDAFIAAGQGLVAGGCTGLTTTCGFLTLLREEVAEACGVPVVSSALELVPGLLAAGEVPGILTISAASLSAAHLAAGGVPEGTPVQGVDGGTFARAILGNEPALDLAASERELVAGAERLCADHPEVTVIVLECTNMPPHQAAIEAATGRQVVSILTAVDALRARVEPRAPGVSSP